MVRLIGDNSAGSLAIATGFGAASSSCSYAAVALARSLLRKGADIYRKYYGTQMAVFLFCTFYAAMAGAGYLIELVFGGLGLIPDRASAHVVEAGLSWNYTTWLNIIFLALAAVLTVWFARTGGVAMLRMMDGAPEPGVGSGASNQAGSGANRR